jgi:cell wall-associated NlpC family hydrolase
MLLRAAANHLGNRSVRVLSGLLLLLLNGCAGTLPEPESGFDCSGFVRHVYARFGVSLPRTTREMAERLPEIPPEQCASGDLLFFHVANKPFSHVGLYLGEGRFIHAPSIRSGGVTISSLKLPFWRKRLAGARRPPPLPAQ